MALPQSPQICPHAMGKGEAMFTQLLFEVSWENISVAKAELWPCAAAFIFSKKGNSFQQLSAKLVKNQAVHVTILTKFSCLFPARVRRDQTQTQMKFDEFFFEYVPGSVNCEENSPKLPTPGIELIENAFLPLQPNENCGSPVFNLQRFVSTSCMRWDYEGVTTLSTRSGNRNVKASQSKKVTDLAKENVGQVNANAAVKMGMFSAKVSAEYKFQVKEGSKQLFNRSWELLTLDQVDNQFVVRDDFLKSPTLDEDLLNTFEICAGQFESVKKKSEKAENKDSTTDKTKATLTDLAANTTCLWDLFRTRSHFLKTASVGSRTTKARKVCLLLKSIFSLS